MFGRMFAVLLVLILSAYQISPVLAEEFSYDVKVGGFRLHVINNSDVASEGFEASFYYQNKPVPEYDLNGSWIDASSVVHDFPVKGCESARIEYFTGGANCCYRNYILSSCNGKDSVTLLGGKSFRIEDATEELSKKGAIYEIVDESLSPYWHDDIILARYQAPVMGRLLLFDDGWRFDRRGEFRDFYINKIKKIREEGEHIDENEPIEEDKKLSDFMRLAYYSLMAEVDETTVMRTFIVNIATITNISKITDSSQDYLSIADTIFTDIVAAVDNIRPDYIQKIAILDLFTKKVLSHKVARGDTLYSISKKYGSSVGGIVGENPAIKNTSVIKAGQMLRIPVLEYKQ